MLTNHNWKLFCCKVHSATLLWLNDFGKIGEAGGHIFEAKYSDTAIFWADERRRERSSSRLYQAPKQSAYVVARLLFLLFIHCSALRVQLTIFSLTIFVSFSHGIRILSVGFRLVNWGTQQDYPMQELDSIFRLSRRHRNSTYVRFPKWMFRSTECVHDTHNEIMFALKVTWPQSNAAKH